MLQLPAAWSWKSSPKPSENPRNSCGSGGQTRIICGLKRVDRILWSVHSAGSTIWGKQSCHTTDNRGIIIPAQCSSFYTQFILRPSTQLSQPESLKVFLFIKENYFLLTFMIPIGIATGFSPTFLDEWWCLPWETSSQLIILLMDKFKALGFSLLSTSRFLVKLSMSVREGMSYSIYLCCVNTLKLSGLQ